MIRAVEIIKAAGFHADGRPIEAEEIIADLIEHSALATAVISGERRDRARRPRPTWMRFLPRMR